MNTQHIQAVVQVRSKVSRLCFCFKVTCGGSQDPNVDFSRLRLSHTPDFALLQDPQQLDLQRLPS